MMVGKTKRRLSALALASAVLVPVAAGAQTGQSSAAAKPRSSTNDCFYLHDTQGDVPYGDRAVLFRVNVSEIYRLDFADRCRELTDPNPKLILTPENGNDLICHAIDLNVKVSEQPGFDIPISCIPTGLHRLTPAEVSAIPKKDLP